MGLHPIDVDGLKLAHRREANLIHGGYASKAIASGSDLRYCKRNWGRR
jgi:hypothetical protein